MSSLPVIPPNCIMLWYMWYLRCPALVPSHSHHLYHHHRALWTVNPYFLLTFPRPMCAGLRSHQKEVSGGHPKRREGDDLPTNAESSQIWEKSRRKNNCGYWGVGLKTAKEKRKGRWRKRERKRHQHDVTRIKTILVWLSEELNTFWSQLR